MKFLVFIFLLIGFHAQGQELFSVNRNLRALGMGGVYIPTVTPADTIFYNPAALGKVHSLNLQALNLGLGVNGMDVYNKVKDAGDLSQTENFDRLVGTRVWLDGFAKASFTMPNFGFGYYTDFQQNLELHDPAFPKFKTFFQNDSAIVVGTAFDLGSGTSLGVSFKRMQRWGGETLEIEASSVTNMDDVVALKDRFENKGQGYGADLAVMKTLDGPFSPSFSLVWRDVGDTAFSKTAGVDNPPAVKQDLVFGTGANLDLPGLDVAVGLEARHLLEPEIQIGKKLHAGAEISLPFLDLRGGFNQGYLSYGVGFNFLFFRFDAVSYSEELGSYPGQTADNRIMVGVGIDLSFDVDFNFTDNNGKKSKLKQRR